MWIETTRFGKLEVDETRLITFKEGILGFAQHRQYALIQTGPDPAFFWLQAVDQPALAFVVCDPSAFVPDYTVPIQPHDVAALELRDLTDCQVLAIVNKVDGWLTANLLGPIVVGAHSRLAKQLVRADKRYGTRQRLLRRAEPRAVAKTA